MYRDLINFNDDARMIHIKLTYSINKINMRSACAAAQCLSVNAAAVGSIPTLGN